MKASVPAETGTSAMDDRPAIERLRHDDRAAIAELYQRHAGAVYWNAWAVLRSRPDAEEMTADAFLTLWTRRREIEIFGSSALPWLVVTVKNLSRNRLRANARRRTDGLDDAEQLPATTPSAEHVVALDEAMRLIRGVVEQLSVTDQSIFRLCMVEQLTYKEAAARLGLKHGSIRNRLSRTRHRLQRELGFQNEGHGHE